MGPGIHTLTITGAGENAGATGDLDITTPMTLTGVGPSQTAIDASGLISDRVLHVWPAEQGASIVISGVAIVNGTVDGFGGGLFARHAALALVNTHVASNTATGSAGGLYTTGSTGVLTFFGDVLVAANAAEGYCGGLYVRDGIARLYSGQIVSNWAQRGGGIAVYAARAEIDGSSVLSNTASGYGGGVYLENAASAVTVTGASLIAWNSADDYGGGIENHSGRLTLAGGQIAHNTAGRGGGGIRVDQADAHLVQTGATLISENASTETGSFNGGGGLFVRFGTANLSGAEIVSNTSRWNGGGFLVMHGHLSIDGGKIAGNAAHLRGGGIYVDQGASITQSGATLVAGNVATGTGMSDGGGGMCVWEGDATLDGATVMSNASHGNGGGGGIHVAEGGRLTATATAVVTNEATSGPGGGVLNEGHTTLVNTTVSANAAAAGAGGLHNEAGGMTATFATIVGNTSADAEPGDGLYVADGTLTALNTIIADNGLTSCQAVTSTLVSLGYNLDDGTSCDLHATGDITDTDPLLGPLMVEDGTWIHPLFRNSPAVDTGTCVSGVGVDQRGTRRPHRANCDIGAYELEGPSVFLPLAIRTP